MSDDPTQDPSTFDPDEDLFNFDEVALEFYSSNDEEDLEYFPEVDSDIDCLEVSVSIVFFISTALCFSAPATCFFFF